MKKEKKESSWKQKSPKYLFELQKLLDEIENIKDEELKQRILHQALKSDNELTILSERLFEEFYQKGLNK